MYSKWKVGGESITGGLNCLTIIIPLPHSPVTKNPPSKSDQITKNV